MPERAFIPFPQIEVPPSPDRTEEIDALAMQENIQAHGLSPIGQRNLTPRERRKIERVHNDRDEMAHLEKMADNMARAIHPLEKDPRFVDTIGAEALYADILWFDSLVDEHGQNRVLMERFKVYEEALEKSKNAFLRIIREGGKVYPISGYTPGEIFDKEIQRMRRLLKD